MAEDVKIVVVGGGMACLAAAVELDDFFAGHVEGAIRSGRRAAAQVAVDLRERM